MISLNQKLEVNDAQLFSAILNDIVSHRFAFHHNQDSSTQIFEFNSNLYDKNV